TLWVERERGGERPGPGRRRGGELHQEGGRKPSAPREIDRTDRPHPRLASTPARNAVDGDLGEIAIVAVCIADEHRPHLGRCRLEAEPAHVLRTVRVCHDIAGEVDTLFAPTQIAGPLAPRLEHLIGHRARMILSKTVALAVAEASEIG